MFLFQEVGKTSMIRKILILIFKNTLIDSFSSQVSKYFHQKKKYLKKN